MHQGDIVRSMAAFAMSTLTASATRSAFTDYRSDLEKAYSKLHDALQQSGRKQAALEQAHALMAKTQRAMTRMMSAVSDCRFNVSEALCITDPSPQLHDMLGGAGGHNELFGRSLTDFVSADDARRMRSGPPKRGQLKRGWL